MDIVIKGLCKQFGRVDALNEVDAAFAPGIVGLLGPNGAGKTTLMRILATILDANRGEIVWGGLNWSHPRGIKGKVGYLPQQFSMYRYLKVAEALRDVALLKDVPAKQEKGQVELALERANLTEYANRRVGQLSGGMLRRLGIAQAVLGEPPLLILDEPSVGLDPAERIHLRKLIRDYADGQRIILISSHIVDDVESLCDQVTIMNHGRIVTSGSTLAIQAEAGGHVKEQVMEEAAFRRLEKDHTVISFAPTAQGYRVRYLDEQADGAAIPTLEDSYTYLLGRDRAL